MRRLFMYDKELAVEILKQICKTKIVLAETVEQILEDIE